MTDQEFEDLLALGHETNGVEFKGPGARTDRPFLAKVIRAILGMANRRDGGFVILGVEATSLKPIGLSDEDANFWRIFDDLSVSVNEYASPNVSFDLNSLVYRACNFVIIRVHEFEDIPVLCRKDYGEKGKQVLRRGACYVRARHKPETSEIPSEEEMRELLELAIDKGLKKYVARAQRAGLIPGAPRPSVSPGDEDRFNRQVEDLR